MEDDIPVEGGLMGSSSQQRASISMAKTNQSHLANNQRQNEIWNPTIDEYGEEQEAMSSPEETKIKPPKVLSQDSYDQEEDSQKDGEDYAVDRAIKIGFFIEENEFCMTAKDVKTVQRRFRLFYLNWKDFQQKDMIVKKSVIVDDGTTFKP